MRIAMMTNNYKPFIGGVPISIERLTLGLRELGHEVVVFAPRYEKCEKEEDVVRYHSFRTSQLSGMNIPNSFDPEIERTFCKQKFDLIHVHHPMMVGKTAVYLSKKYHVPLVFTYHTRYEQYLHYLQPFTWLFQENSKDGYLQKARKCLGDGIQKKAVPLYLNRFLRHCSHVFVPTDSMHKYITDDCRYQEGGVSVLPTGISDESFIREEGEIQKIKDCYQAEGMPLFCTVSRMAKEKNIPFLLQSLAVFRKAYGKPFKMLMIGEGPDREVYEKMCEDLQLEEVYFTGNIPNENLYAYYQAADLFLFASKSETQGIVILEAMAAGTPVVAVDATGISDIVENGVNGYTVSEDYQEFSDKIQQLLQDEEMFRNCSLQAVNTAKKYSKCSMARYAANVYEQLLSCDMKSTYKYQLPLYTEKRI